MSESTPPSEPAPTEPVPPPADAPAVEVASAAPVPETETEPATESVTEPKPATEAETETEPVTESETEPATEPKPEPQLGPASPPTAASLPALSVGETDDFFFTLMAGQARYELFVSLIDLGVPTLLADGPRSAAEILEALKLDAHRGRKWLVQLERVGLMERLPAQPGDGTPERFQLVPKLRALFFQDGYGGWFYRDFVRFYRVAAYYPLIEVLRGMKVDNAIPYPPNDEVSVEALHAWMRFTVPNTLLALERAVDFSQVEWLLDVGGGDGTMAIALHRKYPELRINIFNLPQVVGLIHQNLLYAQAWDRVSPLPGDFRTDELPGGNNMVMFSRVLADWPPELCRTLLQKAHRALQPDGKVVICEPFEDDNMPLVVAFEQGYLPYDDFGANLSKPVARYLELLAETGFKVLSVHPRQADSVHGVIVAQRLDS